MRFFKFVSCVTQNSFNLYSWNLIGISMVMWTCAPSYFGFHLWYQTWVICPLIVKNEVFKFVSHITKKTFYIHSLNCIGLSMVMCTCIYWFSYMLPKMSYLPLNEKSGIGVCYLVTSMNVGASVSFGHISSFNFW